MKRRWLRYLAVALGLLGLGVLWAFSTFLFNPFEGRLELPLVTLLPRDVDFFVGKEGLREEWEPFPRHAVVEALARTESGRAVLELEAVEQLLAGLRLEETLAALQSELERLPVRADPLEIFAGEEVALAGTFRGSDLAQADWVLVGRANWMGKLGLELVRSGLVDVEAHGLQRSELPRGFSLSGEGLPRTLHLARILDVLVVATQPELIDQVHELRARRGEDSFGLSAKYHDHAAGVGLQEDALQAYLDHRRLAESLGLSGRWPDPSVEGPAAALAGKLFQAGTVRELMATVTAGNGLTLHATGQLSSELMTPFQQRVYRHPGLERAHVLELARMAPPDVGLFVCARGPLEEILSELAAALDESTLTLLEDPIRTAFGYEDLHPLIGDLSVAFEDRFAFFLRDLDYPPDEDPDAPLRTDLPVPAWALALVVDDQERLEELRSRIHQNPAVFGIRGRDPAKGGIFENPGGAGGASVTEYHSPHVAGTGHLATLEMDGAGGRYFVLSNSHNLLSHVFVTYWRDGPRLSDDRWFQTLVNSAMPSVDLALWVNARAVARTTRALAAYRAELDLPLAIDWALERPRIEREVMTEHFPDAGGRLPPQEREAFELLVDEAAQRFEARYVTDNLPRLRAEYERTFVAMEIASGALLELALDAKGFRAYARVVVPVEELAEELEAAPAGDLTP